MKIKKIITIFLLGIPIVLAFANHTDAIFYNAGSTPLALLYEGTDNIKWIKAPPQNIKGGKKVEIIGSSRKKYMGNEYRVAYGVNLQDCEVDVRKKVGVGKTKVSLDRVDKMTCTVDNQKKPHDEVTMNADLNPVKKK